MSKLHVKKDLAAFLHGELNDDAAFRVATHLTQCAECRAEFEEMKLGDDIVKNLRLDVPSDSVWANIEQKLAEKDSPVSRRKKGLFPSGSLKWVPVSFAMVTVLAIVFWWYLAKPPSQTASMNFDKYLTLLESQPRESFPEPFAAVPEMFGKVDSVTAHQAIGIREVGQEMASLGYQLYGNRLRPTSAGNLAQFIYGNANEVIAVFILPKSVKCDFGRRPIESARLSELSYAKVVSETVSTLWLGNKQHQLVFVTFNADQDLLANVVRLFIGQD